jgi:hypothetical protein
MSNSLHSRFAVGFFTLVVSSTTVLMSPVQAHGQHGANQPGSTLTDETAITHVMKSQFDRPEAALTVMPVSIESDFAVAGWIQGSTGGRALLKKASGKWSIHLCAGEALTQVSTLEMAGIDSAAAKRLAQKVSIAERRLPAEHARKLSLFEGVLKIDGGAHHGHRQPHGQSTYPRPGH